MYPSLGGPGGSGINFVRLHGDNLRTIVDSPFNPDDYHRSTDTEKYFDILSFDPRGVGSTTPNFICFPDALQRSYWQMASDAEGLLGSSNVALKTMWARKQALAEACYSRMAKDEDGNTGLGGYMNTPNVAMDMAAIVESWRGFSDESHAAKLQYWGFSYGTLLGETFAAMYPHLVGRLVLDGVVDSDRHYPGRVLRPCSSTANRN
jgi:pimeloyl-ACP methyl ester carboxylesterase